MSIEILVPSVATLQREGAKTTLSIETRCSSGLTVSNIEYDISGTMVGLFGKYLHDCLKSEPGDQRFAMFGKAQISFLRGSDCVHIARSGYHVPSWLAEDDASVVADHLLAASVEFI